MRGMSCQQLRSRCGYSAPTGVVRRDGETRTSAKVVVIERYTIPSFVHNTLLLVQSSLAASLRHPFIH